MEKKSRILIVGGTGKLGFEIAKASLRSSHPTFALIRDESFSDPHKSHKLQTLSDSGATLLKGSLEDETRLIEAIKQVDVVICAVSSKQVLLQKLLISAIKQAGCVKKFIPSEFGVDPCKTRISGLDHNFYARKAEIRCLVEAEGIPYTYICCNFFMSYLLPSIVQPGLKSPPRDKIKIFGDKNAKGVFMKESDVASFTISAVDDPLTLNKVLHLRPRGNVYSMNELVEIWESKIGKKLEKIYVPEEELLKKIKETPYPDNMDMVFIYSAFVKGDHTYFDIESSGGVDGTKLYPHLKYTTISHGHHDKIIKAADKLKASRDRQTKRVKELELRLGTLKGKVVEAEKKLQTMDSVLKSSSQEITVLNEEKEQLSAALTASKKSLADEVKATKEEGCNEATVVYEVQFAKLGNMLFEDDWTFALQVTNVPMESELRKNIPYPCPDAVEKPSGETVEGAGIENLPTV